MLFAAPVSQARPPLQAAGNDSLFVPLLPSYSKKEITDAPLRTLADYQARALQDIQKAPWIGKNGVTLLAVSGAAAALLVTQHFRYRYLLKRQAETFRNVNGRLFADAVSFAKENAQKDISLARAAHDNKLTNDLLQDSRQENAALKSRNSALGNQNAALNRTVQNQQNALNEMRMFSNNNIQGFDKTVKTIADKLARGQGLEIAEINLLTEGISPAEAKKFLLRVNAIDKLSRGTAAAVKKELIEDLLTAIPRMHPEAVSLRTALYIKGILKELKGLAFITLAVTLVLNGTDAKAQKTVWRINGNFNLFLNATEEELAALEQDEDLRQTCINGAEALHLMSQMGKEESLDFQNQVLPLPARRALPPGSAR